ncbi:two component LuxR family transcriptional regulator [Isoalcanivorax pacificus W11-5]|uniref:Two component LuxR family transcriptional regulator n=1 Tax=Isoalcanivorax pacificus W11-5 TaxID=391936 RepID=A0A0B4XMK2_9GAMM|nr:response regulator transcription factor [Isoalcanivorax pacificus]AJD47880.1 two component LuxR family transcriptional regulator [Isoalcanivorax pacificus W11-5]
MDTPPSLTAEPALPSPVLIVEDDPLIRRRLERILLQVGYRPDMLCHAASLAEARQHQAAQCTALALVDLGLPDGHGTELIAELRAADPAMGILVISAWSTEDAIMAALRAGATGYLLKERDDLEVSLSIRSVLRGGAPIDPFIARRLIGELYRAPPVSDDATLSTREGEVLLLVADGLSNREIAERLHISRYTVESHVKHIYRKLAVSSRIRAISEARSRGLLDG